jgi:hypothetical protein
MRGTIEFAVGTGAQVAKTVQRTGSELSRSSSAGAPDAKTLERRGSESEMSAADTPVASVARRNAEEWPADREARGEITLKASANHGGAIRAVCSVRDGVLTMSVRSAGNTAVVVEVPVGELAVGLQRESVEMFTVATLPKNRMYDDHDEIYCFVDNQVKRNKWIAVFRRMGVPIFDLSYGHAKALRL